MWVRWRVFDIHLWYFQSIVNQLSEYHLPIHRLDCRLRRWLRWHSLVYDASLLLALLEPFVYPCVSMTNEFTKVRKQHQIELEVRLRDEVINKNWFEWATTILNELLCARIYLVFYKIHAQIKLETGHCHCLASLNTTNRNKCNYSALLLIIRSTNNKLRTLTFSSLGSCVYYLYSLSTKLKRRVHSWMHRLLSSKQLFYFSHSLCVVNWRGANQHVCHRHSYLPIWHTIASPLNALITCDTRWWCAFLSQNCFVKTTRQALCAKLTAQYTLVIASQICEISLSAFEQSFDSRTEPHRVCG